MNLNNLSGHIPQTILSILPAAFEHYNINTAIRAAHFLGQVSHESGCFKTKAENLNYSNAQHIVDTWRNRFNLTGGDGKLNANDYIDKPQQLADVVYAGRMGNNNINDGFTYRGGGFLQITGKGIYTLYADHLNKPVETIPNLLMNDDRYALDSALWMWCDQYHLIPISDEGVTIDVITHIRRIINGGSIGLQDSIEQVQHYYQLLNGN